MAKTPIQLPRYLIRKPKNEAMAALRDYVTGHTSEFVVGEEIIMRYLLRPDDTIIVSTNVVVNDPVSGDLSFVIGESDTIKIVESNTEPEEKDVLWLTDSSGSEDFGNIREELNALKKRFKTLQDIVNQHEYAFKNSLSGGNIKSNATKFSLSNLAAQEEPRHSEDVDYNTEDTAITTVKVYVGKYELESSDTLYVKQKYYLNTRAFNEDEEEVSLSGCTIVYDVEGDVEIGPENTIYCEEEGNATISATVILPDSGTVSSEAYSVTFSDEEEPSYYTEPTYHQFTTKNAKDFAELTKYIDNLAVGEFCWCIADNALYYRAEAAGHTIQIFKINGGGSSPEVDEITYEITDDGILIITAENDSVYIDEDGILHFPGELDENGILHLNDKKKE